MERKPYPRAKETKTDGDFEAHLIAMRILWQFVIFSRTGADNFRRMAGFAIRRIIFGSLHKRLSLIAQRVIKKLNELKVMFITIGVNYGS